MAGNFSKVSGEGIQDLSKMGVDKRGIRRGACIECRQCDDYETPKDGHDCDCCGCKPPKHPATRPATDLGTQNRDDTTRTKVAKKIRLEEICFQQQSDDEVSTGACSIDKCDELRQGAWGASDDDDTNITETAQNLNDDGKFRFLSYRRMFNL